jgi:hypothetical protein
VKLKAELSFVQRRIPRDLGFFDSYEAILKTPDKGAIRLIKGLMPTDQRGLSPLTSDLFDELKKQVEQDAREFAKELGYEVVASADGR